MQFLIFCILLSAFSGALIHEVRPQSAGPFGWSACLAMVGLLGCLGKFSATRVARGYRSGVSQGWQIADFHIHTRSILWFWTIVSPAYLVTIGWGSYSTWLMPGTTSLTWTFLWWSLPGIGLLCLMDIARQQLFHAIDYRVRSGAGWWIIIAPSLATCMVWDLWIGISHWCFGAERTSPILSAAVLIAVMAIALPHLMLRFWSTEPLNASESSRVALATWIHVGGTVRSIRCWRTDRTIASAMVFGWFRPSRYLLLSDLLLERLSGDELRMIVLHEAAHLRRGHVGWRLLPVLLMALPMMAISSVGKGKIAIGLIHAETTPLSLMLLMLGSLIGSCLLLSWVARRTELDADAAAVELAATRRERSGVSRQQAARALIQALEKIVPASQASKTTWLHPSLDCRVDFLRRRYFKEPVCLLES